MDGSLLAPLMNSSKDSLPVMRRPKKDSQSAAVERVMMCVIRAAAHPRKSTEEILMFEFMHLKHNHWDNTNNIFMIE